MLISRCLDELLVFYIETNYDKYPSPGRKQDMYNLLSFLVLTMPNLKRKLQLARRSLTGWGKLVPTQPSLPLTRDVMLAFMHFLSMTVALCLQLPLPHSGRVMLGVPGYYL